MSNFTLDEWKAIAELGTRGDMVHDILKDWDNDLRKPVEAKAEAGGPGIGELLHQIEMALEDWKQHGLRGRRSAAQWIINKVMDAIIRPSPAANTEGRGLREALAGLARGTDGDGQVCFCEVAIGNPMMHGDHSAACRKARAALRGEGK